MDGENEIELEKKYITLKMIESKNKVFKALSIQSGGVYEKGIQFILNKYLPNGISNLKLNISDFLNEGYDYLAYQLDLINFINDSDEGLKRILNIIVLLLKT